MNESHSNRYRHQRWPLIKYATSCIFWMLTGTFILIFSAGYFRLVGIFPLGYGLLKWLIHIRPRWKYTIHIETEQLRIGNQSYDWNRFDQMQIERKDTGRCIRLSGEDNKLNVTIKDDLPEFEQLAQDCFFHLSQKRSTPHLRSRTNTLEQRISSVKQP